MIEIKNRWSGQVLKTVDAAYLSGAYLSGANLRGVREALGIKFDPALPGRVLRQITEHPETHDQCTWHSICGTKHCVAGWTTHLAGHIGKYMDRQLGTATAATLLLWQPGKELPSFAPDATSEETIGRLRILAGES